MAWSAAQAIRDYLAGKELRMINFWCAVNPYMQGYKEKNELPEVDEQTWKDLFDECSYLVESGSMCGTIHRVLPLSKQENKCNI
ncbi:MAG: hypothetical protein WC663_06205 [Patescibacteria group bacterium]|jgi:hypothetical protein